MFKTILRNYVGFFIILLLVAGCEGQSCIEAEDFGEYDTDVITVDAKRAGCDWTDNADLGSGDEVIARCLKDSTAPITISGTSCKVSFPKGGDCYETLKSCVNDGENCNFEEDVRVTGDDCGSPTNAVITAYNQCLEKCQNTCQNGISSFEDTWEPNNLKEKGSYQGIEIGTGSKIQVQALGTIVVRDGEKRDYSFGLNNKNIVETANGKVVNLTTTLPLSVSGRWCKGGSSLDSCRVENQIGEFPQNSATAGQSDNTNVAARTNFLRRGVVILKSLPAGGSINSDGVYTGPLMWPDFNAWKCSFEESNGLPTPNYVCETDFLNISGADHAQENTVLYGMNNNFVKSIGGYVVPQNVMEYITTNPFEDTICVSELGSSGYVRSCENFSPIGFSAKYSDTDEGALLKSGYMLRKPSGATDDKIVANLFYPSKLAFKVIGAPNSSSDECTVTVNLPNNPYIEKQTFKVRADGKWHFLVDQNDPDTQLLLNKDDYSTIERLKVGSDHQNLSSSKSYKVEMSFKEGETWGDADGNRIPCGEGTAAFFIPQNEVLIDTSGFVSFKNLLSSNFRNCSAGGSIDSNKNHKCMDSQDVTFTIINPLYDHKHLGTSVVEPNFYEYKEGRTLKPEQEKVTLTLGSGSNWAGDIFVRKGQILRFDEKNWFDISVPAGAADTNTYEIKNKVLRLSDTFTSKNSDGLFLKIKERPALLCSEDVVTEEIDNPLCSKVITEGSDGDSVGCSLSYTDVCMEQGSDRYCPFGCYGDYFVDGSAGGTCQISTEMLEDESTKSQYGDQGITEDGCRKCSAYIKDENNIPKPSATIEVIQCYDLEDYAGSVSNLLKDKLNFLSRTGSVINVDYAKQVSSDQHLERGMLTDTDISLGAKKLKSVFENGSYGTLDGVELDESDSKKDEKTGLYTEFVYVADGGLQISSPKNLSFLVLDNSDFRFNSANSYSNNTGQYNLSFSPQESVSNGAQLAVVIANKDWDNKIPTGNVSQDSGFKAWVVKYNVDKKPGEYGNLAPDSLYEFNSNGFLVNRSTKAEGVDMATLSSYIKGVNEDEYSNLRLFFKVIDKEEKTGCNGDTFSISETVYECRCMSKYEGSAAFNEWGSCEREFDCKSLKEEAPNGQEIDKGMQIERREVTECRNDLYYNNSGKYTVQLKTSKDVLNSTGYIVKYIMEPILEILDGRTAGFAVDNQGKMITCGNGTYVYGGDLPEWKVGTQCSASDPTFGRYCKTATFTASSGACGGNDPDCDSGLRHGERVNDNTFRSGDSVFLPGARKELWGRKCNPEDRPDPSKGATEYPNYCFALSDNKCSVYIKPDQIDVYDDKFGTSCKSGDPDCYENCSSLDVNTYKTRCKFVNNGLGFVQRFYGAVINDSAYQIILRLCFTLMIMFYGMYYLLGMAKLTHGELIRRVIKISFIYLMVGKDGWYYYNMFFVQFFKSGVDYLVFAVAGAFDDSSSLNAAFIKNDFFDKSVLFSGVDKNLALMFSDQVSYKIWGLLFVSFFGWLYVFLIYSSIIAYILAVANALLLYLTAQFFISMLLAFGPIFFVLLVFEKTRESFDKWISNLITFSLEQIFLLTCLSLFNTLVYNVIKFVLSYRVCWRPVWVLNIPVLGQIELMSFWKATTASSPSAAASAVPGLFQVLLIYLMADLMSNFIKLMTDLGGDLGGGGLSSSGLSSSIQKAASDFYKKNIAGTFKNAAKKTGAMIAKKTIGYKTKEEEKQEKESNKTIRSGIKAANRQADKAVDRYKKENAKELLNMSTDERAKKLSEVRDNAFKESVNSNSKLQTEFSKRQAEFKEKGINSLEDFGSHRASEFTNSNDLVGFAFNKATNAFGSGARSSDKTKDISEGKKGVGYSKKEIKGIYNNELKASEKDLREARGGVFRRNMTDADFEKKLGGLQSETRGKIDEAIKKEDKRKQDDASRKKLEKSVDKAMKRGDYKDEVDNRLKEKQADFRNKHGLGAEQTLADVKPPMLARNNKALLDKEFGGRSWNQLDSNEKQAAKIKHRQAKEDWKADKEEWKGLGSEAEEDVRRSKLAAPQDSVSRDSGVPNVSKDSEVSNAGEEWGQQGNVQTDNNAVGLDDNGSVDSGSIEDGSSAGDADVGGGNEPVNGGVPEVPEGNDNDKGNGEE